MLVHLISRHSRLHFLKLLILYSDPPALPSPILHRPNPCNLTFLLQYSSISNDRANNGLETGRRHLSSIPQSWIFSRVTDGPDRISGVVDENVGSMAISAVGWDGVDIVSSGDSTEKESLCRETEEKFGLPKTDLDEGEEGETSALLEGQVRAIRLGIYRALQNWQLVLPLPRSTDTTYKRADER